MYKVVLLVAWVAVAGLARAQMQNCTKESVIINNRLTHTLNSPLPNKRCRFKSTTEPAFSSFYFKPGSKFKLLKIAVIVTSPYHKKNINIKENIISNTEKWYHIELKEEDNQSTYIYTAHIDGEPYDNEKRAFKKRASMIYFDVKGFPSHYSDWNPALGVTPAPSPRPATDPPATTPATVPPATTPATVPPATTPATVPPATTSATDPPATTSATVLPATTPATVPPATTPATVPPATTSATVPPATTSATVPPATTPTTVPPATTPVTVPPATTSIVPSTTPPAPVTTVLPPKPASRAAIENHSSEADFRGDHYQIRYPTPPAYHPIITAPSLYIILIAGVPGTLLVVTVAVVSLAIRRSRSRRRLAMGVLVRESSRTGNSYFLCQQNLPDLTRNLGQNPDDYVYDEEADQALVTFQLRGKRVRRDSEGTT